MNKNILVVLLFLSFSFLWGQQLKEAVRMGLERNPQVQAARHAAAGARFKAKAAFRATLPSLSMDASYRHVTDVPELQLPFAPAPGVPLPAFRLGAYDSYDTGLSLQYVLFSGFAQQKRTTLTRRQALLAETNLKQARKETALNIVAAYRQVQLARLEIEALTAARERVAVQLQRLRNLVAQGMTLAVDTLSLTLSRLSYDQKLIQAQAELENAAQNLNTLVGQTVEVGADSVPNPPPVLPELRPERIEVLRTLQIKKQISQTATGISKAVYYPSVALQAAYRYGKPGLDMIQNEWMQYGVWGVSFQWNLFNWQSDQFKVAAGREQQREIDFKLQAARDRVRNEYQKNVRLYRALQKQTAVLKTALTLARRKMALIKDQYEQGLRSATDFNTANLELTRARLNLERHRLNLLLKYNQLQFLSGQPISEWSM